MAPAIEIAIFPSNEAYRKDPSIVHPLLDIVAEAKGSLGIYHGLQSEDGKTGYLFIVWETLEDHHNLMNAPIYETLKKHAGACVEGPLDVFHVHFEPTVAPIFNGPITSFALITKLKPGKTGEDVTVALSSLAGAKDVTGCHGGAYGKVVEKDQFAFVTGWDKIEDHAKARTEHLAIVDFLNKLNGTVEEWNAKHVHLTSYRKKYE